VYQAVVAHVACLQRVLVLMNMRFSHIAKCLSIGAERIAKGHNRVSVSLYVPFPPILYSRKRTYMHTTNLMLTNHSRW
jgi:hypothetical protein